MRKGRLLALAAVAMGCASGGGEPAQEVEAKTLRSLAPDVRLDYLREAAVWSQIDTASLDLREGPPGGRFPDSVLKVLPFPIGPVHGFIRLVQGLVHVRHFLAQPLLLVSGLLATFPA